MRPAIHLLLHLLVPGLVARFSLRSNRWRGWLTMVLTMAVDLDHLLIAPIYDAARCSIGFHPLHTPVAIGVYVLVAVIPRLRLVSLGLLIHMALDGIDCLWMSWEQE